MRRLPLVVLTAATLAACQLQKSEDPSAALRPVGTGIVTSVERVQIDNTRSPGERMAMSALVGGLPAAAFNAYTETDLQDPNARQYVVRLTTGETMTVRAYSVVREGDCVTVRLGARNDPASLLRRPAEACQPKDETAKP